MAKANLLGDSKLDDEAPPYMIDFYQQAMAQVGEFYRPMLLVLEECDRCYEFEYFLLPFKLPKASRIQKLCPLCVKVLQLQKKPDLSFAQ